MGSSGAPREAVANPRETSDLLRRLIGLGPFRSTLAVTSVAGAGSLAIAVVVTAALGRLSAMGVGMSLAIPLVLVPATWYPVFRMLARLEAAEERLRRARKMESLGLLAGGVAHDLNNILAGVVGYPDVLLLDYPDDPRLRAKLTIIRDAGERAAGIVRDLLTLARREVTPTEPIDLNGVVAAYLDSPGHEVLLRERPDVRFATEIDPDLGRIEGSGVHLSKAVMNLVLNAFEAIPAAGSVVVSTRRRRLEAPLAAYEEVPPGDYATLTVADSGVGMAPEDLERIFEPFFTRKVLGRSGTGLGMAVVWGVVKDSRGYVDVVSAPGEGTAVTLFFPAVPRDRSVVARPAPDPVPPRGHGERVLVVDDRLDQRELATEMLRRLGYRAEAVAGGPEAIAALGRDEASVVVVDMIMEPGPDGLDTSRMIRERWPGLPIVLATGYGETDRVRAALALGGVRFLAKPYRLEPFARLVHLALAPGPRAPA